MMPLCHLSGRLSEGLRCSWTHSTLWAGCHTLTCTHTHTHTHTHTLQIPYSNAIFSSEFFSIEGAGIHSVEGHFTGSCQDGSRLGEEIIICCLTLNGSDQHGVTSILVRLQLCVGRGEREGVKQIKSVV